MLKKEHQFFAEYVRRKNLKHSGQREKILEIFLKNEKHMTADELYGKAREVSPGIGYATIYRTLKLLCDSGLCREFRCEDGLTRYEHLYGRAHHDHLICTKCGKFVEVVDPEIERLQERLAKLHGFYPERHRMELYGVCKKCKK